MVEFRAVRQQPTVVDIAAPRGQVVARLLGSTGLRVRSETRMAGWLATHSVFIGGMGSALLAAGGAARVARAAERVHGLVVAVSEAFDALQHGGHQVRPPALRAIFGRVPTWFATRYWQRQFGAPLVQVSIEPHILATRDTEFPRLLDFTLTLVGRAAPRYRALVEPWSTDDGR